MPKVIIDGKEIEFAPGESIIKVAERAQNHIPRYCYHEGLSVVAQCRMCLVEVEGARKLVTACSTPCTDGMKVNTKSEKVKTAVAGVQEFLLANHPLDCPICDQAGECSLQDYSYKHGNDDSRFDFFRRTFIDVDMGPSIKKNMNRCIHCTRCIRYCDEVGKIHEMAMVDRGNNTEIVTIDNNPLQTAYAGGLADVCPVGSLTTKDFRFKKRVWFLRTSPGVCDGCSQGCNITVSQENGVIYRTEARENQQINKWWICDEGRYGFHHAHSPSRITAPAEVSGGETRSIAWKEAVEKVQGLLKSAKSVGALICADATNEEVAAMKKYLPQAKLFSFSPTCDASSQDKAIDHLLRRSDKSPNLKGMEEAGLAPFSKFQPKDFDLVLVVSAGKVRAPWGVASLAKTAVAMGVFMKEELNGFRMVLPGLATLEKAGSFVNHQGVKQTFPGAVMPAGMSRPIESVLQSLAAEPRKVG